MPTSEIKDDAVLLNGKIHSLPITKEYVLSELNFVFESISKLPGSRMLNPCNTLPPPPSPRAVVERRKKRLSKTSWRDGVA